MNTFSRFYSISNHTTLFILKVMGTVNFVISIFSTFHYIIIPTVLFILRVTVVAYTSFVVFILYNFYGGL